MRADTKGMTLVELSFALIVIGGLGWGVTSQIAKLRKRVKAIGVKVLVRELDEMFDSHVSEFGLPLPVVKDAVTLESYHQMAKTPSGELPLVPDPQNPSFDFRLSSTTDSWKLTVLEKGKDGEGPLMSCGYRFHGGGSVEVNEESPWGPFLKPTCLVADKSGR